MWDSQHEVRACDGMLHADRVFQNVLAGLFCFPWGDEHLWAGGAGGAHVVCSVTSRLSACLWTKVDFELLLRQLSASCRRGRQKGCTFKSVPQSVVLVLAPAPWGSPTGSRQVKARCLICFATFASSVMLVRWDR